MFGGLDILVNNAAVYEMSSVEDAIANTARLDRLFTIIAGGVQRLCELSNK